MTTLVIGSTGQLARHLRELLPAAKFWSRSDADLAFSAELESKLLAARPSFIVNAAAYTAVDRAESEPEMAWRVNAEAPAAIARAAAKLGVPLVHVSTDYVFDGRSAGAYQESDPVGPLNIYGSTKLGGELAVRAIHTQHWILRTSWVFSEHGANFAKTMLRLARERTELSVVADQHGRPTYAGHLAEAIATLSRRVDAVPFGTHHATGGAIVSWHAFATHIIDRAHRAELLVKRPVIRPVGTSDYPTAAQRPTNSALEPSATLGKIVTFDWESGLDRVISQLSASSS